MNSVNDENRIDKSVYEDLERLRLAFNASLTKETEKLSEDIKYCRDRIDILNDNMATHEDINKLHDATHQNINKLSDKLWQLVFVFLTAILGLLSGLIYILLK